MVGTIATGRHFSAVLTLFVMCGVGCSTSSPNVPTRIASDSQQWVDLTSPGSYRPTDPRILDRAFKSDAARETVPSDDTRPAVQVLALSGGGMYGAFGAGVLNGWSRSGLRPQFDVVTGISTGGLIATYAFLGSEYDEELRHLFTTVSDRDIYRKRSQLSYLWAESAATTEPLRRLLDARITPEMLQRVAAEHARGRRLFIGTTNLDTRRLVVWDMGAIASRGDHNLYRDVILASVSVPGAFPPVSIDIQVNGTVYRERHVDGGVSTQVFARAFMLRLDPADSSTEGKAPPGSKIWVIVNGKMSADPGSSSNRIADIALNSVSGILYSQTRNDVLRLFLLAKATGADFALTAVPQDFPVASTGAQFNPVTMRRLFDVGYMLGKSGAEGWKNDAPAIEEIEQSLPRTGTSFAAPVDPIPAPPFAPAPARK